VAIDFLSSTHFNNMRHHWCPRSEAYTGGDSLLSALDAGWVMNTLVFAQTVWHGGSRPTTIYYFELKHGSRMMTMPVIGNPFVDRLIIQKSLQIVTFADYESVGKMAAPG
jgi:hypothetical protein